MSIFNYFNHLNLSQGQETALAKLESFLTSHEQVFMLKGYAGSGKTTILKGLVEYLGSTKQNLALMAPTGRAAKVIRERTGQEAFTVHKTIYSYEDLEDVNEGNSFFYYYKLRSDADVAGKIFIVDEASMLSDTKSEGEFFRFGTGFLLSDLISYTRVCEPNVNSKIIFVGDPCQLPPVNDNSSKAFEADYLKNKFNLTSVETEMKEVQRQGIESGILKAAANIRKSVTAGLFNSFNIKENEIDIFNPSYEIFLQKWETTPSPKVIIAYKNKTCLDLNLQIRNKLFGNPNSPIQKSDIVIMGGNNYAKGIFNGEFAVVNSVSESTISRTIPLRGKDPVTLTWRDVELVFPDTDSSNKIIKCKMIENFLYGDNYLTPEETQALYVDFTMRNKQLKPDTKEFKEAIIKDDYFNCIKLKYGYAVTCHKAQGGEWDNVFTIWDYDNREDFDCLIDKQISTGKQNASFYRWAYTAVTRASKTLYALNPPSFNSYSSMAFIDCEVQNSLNQLTGTQIQSEVISLDQELLNQLTEFKLVDENVLLQDHFIKVRHAARKQFIEVDKWEKINYEIRYTFKRENEIAVFKTHINGKNEFKNPIIPMLNLSPNSSFNDALSEILKSLPNVSIVRNTPEVVLSKIEFDCDIEEEYPFLKNLFDDLNYLFKDSGVIIESLEHQSYKERYTFTSNNEQAVIDFEYKKNGSFGRIVPLLKKCNSQKLLLQIQNKIELIKKEEYVS